MIQLSQALQGPRRSGFIVINFLDLIDDELIVEHLLQNGFILAAAYPGQSRRRLGSLIVYQLS